MILYYTFIPPFSLVNYGTIYDVQVNEQNI